MGGFCSTRTRPDALSSLLSSEALGLRRSRRQALDPLSAVKPVKRGAVLLMWQLGKIGAPLRVAASVEEAVDKLFRDGHPPHYIDAMQDLLPMLKNKTRLRATPRARRLGCL
jgi:hypothetical protein